ncbi:MAG TPA: MFS transporter [Nevskia sp.]|jgi:UMF1 family MFS transporter|nr:MFS transporter [Nevskia sp.]
MPAPARGAKRRAQIAWALNAWGNHAFSTTILVGFFPIFFDRYWAKELPGTTSTFWLGITNSAAAFVVMLLAPWLGALADLRGRKKAYLGWFTVLGVLSSAALALVGAGQWTLALLLFALGQVGFFASYSFNDALLVQVAEPEESDQVSAFGFAMGYLGGGLLFLVNVAMALRPAWFGLADATAATRAAFLTVAAWWSLFCLPLFRYVPEAEPAAQASGWRELWQTLKSVLRNKPVLRFLIAYWLYIDAIGTLQQMAVDFGAKLGFSTSTLITALLLVQFISFPAAWAFGPLARRIGTRRAIYLGLAVFGGLSIWAYFMQTERQFYQMAAGVALVQGGVQALSRSYFSRLIPPGRSGEYFGFYNMLGKFAAILGPLVVGVVALLTGSPHLSIMVLALFFLVGAVLLSRVEEPATVAGGAKMVHDP